MHLPPKYLATSLALIPSLSYAITLTSIDFNNVAANGTYDITWKDASGSVSVLLLHPTSENGEIDVADGLTTSPYKWTVPGNISNGKYQVEVMDDDADTDVSNPFTISGGTGSQSDSIINDGITPPSNLAGQFNHSGLWAFDTDGDDDFSSLSKGALIGISIGAAASLILVLFFSTLAWTYRKKYLEAMTRYGDLLREVYGDDTARAAIVVDIMTPIPDVSEEDERDEEAERKSAERQAKINEQQARIYKQQDGQGREAAVLDKENWEMEEHQSWSSGDATVRTLTPTSLASSTATTEMQNQNQQISGVVGGEQLHAWSEEEDDSKTFTDEKSHMGRRSF